MVRIYDYSVLQAIPDKRRGEKVNIGIAVFHEDGIDIRIFETKKLQSLTGHSWDAYIETYTSLLKETDDPSLEKNERLTRLGVVQNQIVFSKNGWFNSSGGNDYEKTIDEIAHALVIKPQKTRKKSESSVVSEISAVLKSANILAGKRDTLESGFVLRGYKIEDGLEADFAQLNSKLHIASVLDLRTAHPQIAQAALKAIVLDRAQAHTERPIHKIGVYAVAPARRSEVRENIGLLGAYADDLVNWEDESDRNGLKRMFFDAYNSHVDASK